MKVKYKMRRITEKEERIREERNSVYYLMNCNTKQKSTYIEKDEAVTNFPSKA